MKARVSFVLALFFLFYFPFIKTVFAVSVTISDYPSTVTENSFTITASVSGAVTGTNYLKIDLFKDGSENYFGETFNNADWYGGSTYSQYFPISVQSGVTWSGNLQGRVGSPSSTQYDGTGTYKMRLRRYTSGGGYTSSEANNNAVVVSIVIPTPTPTVTSTPTPGPTSTSTPTPTRTPTPTNTPTPKLSVSPTLSKISPTDILKESTQSGLATSQTGGVLSDEENVLAAASAKKPDTLFQKLSVALGIVFIAACAILTFRIIKKGELIQDEEE